MIGLNSGEVVHGASCKLSRAWCSHLLLFGIACLFLFTLYWDVVLSLFRLWWNEGTYSHGFLIFPISLYLIYENRARLIVETPEVRLSGILLIGLVSLVWAGASVTLIEVGQQLAFITFIPIFVWTLFGGRILRKLWFPLFFLLFSIPVWNFFVTLPLQGFTAWMAHKILLILNVPVFRDEHFISIPAGVFHIATSCAGTRYFIAGLTLSTLFAYLMYTKLTKQIIFVLIAVVVYALVNCIRVVVVIMAGHLTEMQHPWVSDHLMLGWGLFVGFSIPLFWAGMRFVDPAVSLAPYQKRPHLIRESTKSAKGVLVVAILMLSLGPVLAYSVQGGREDYIIQLPRAIPPWEGPVHYDGGWSPVYTGASSEGVYTYTNDGQNILFYYAFYAEQKQGHELADSSNVVYDGEIWTPALGGETKEIDLGNVWPHSVNETVIRSNGSTPKLVWQWYSVVGHVTSDQKQAKLFELFKLAGERGGASMTFVLAVDGSDVQSIRGELRQFVVDMAPELKGTVIIK